MDQNRRKKCFAASARSRTSGVPQKIPGAPPMKAILDAGPLIASWNADDKHHAWADNIFKEYQGPFFISGSLLADAAAIERMLSDYSQCDLGDASIVAVSERKKTAPVLTTDR